MTQIVTALDDIRISMEEVKVFPNPFSHLLNIDPDDKSGFYKATVTDILGRVQYVSRLINNYNEIDLSKLKSGFYLLFLEDSKGRRSQFKLVKE